MTQATLENLLTESELISMSKEIDVLKKNVSELSVTDLKNISIYLLRTEYSNQALPSVSLPAIAIQILTERAIRQSYKIFS